MMIMISCFDIFFSRKFIPFIAQVTLLWMRMLRVKFYVLSKWLLFHTLFRRRHRGIYATPLGETWEIDKKQTRIKVLILRLWNSHQLFSWLRANRGWFWTNRSHPWRDCIIFIIMMLLSFHRQCRLFFSFRWRFLIPHWTLPQRHSTAMFPAIINIFSPIFLSAPSVWFENLLLISTPFHFVPQQMYVPPYEKFSSKLPFSIQNRGQKQTFLVG